MNLTISQRKWQSMTSLWEELGFSLWLKFRVNRFLKKLNISCLFLRVEHTLWLLPYHTEQHHKKRNKYFITFYNPLPMLGNICSLSNSHSEIPWKRVKGRHLCASARCPPTPEHQEDNYSDPREVWALQWCMLTSSLTLSLPHGLKYCQNCSLIIA